MIFFRCSFRIFQEQTDGLVQIKSGKIKSSACVSRLTFGAILILFSSLRLGGGGNKKMKEYGLGYQHFLHLLRQTLLFVDKL